jgi:hypothetical protein
VEGTADGGGSHGALEAFAGKKAPGHPLAAEKFLWNYGFDKNFQKNPLIGVFTFSSDGRRTTYALEFGSLAGLSPETFV